MTSTVNLFNNINQVENIIRQEDETKEIFLKMSPKKVMVHIMDPF